MPTLKIDGKEVTVPPNTNVVEAAKQAGIEIPIFCYHPHLTIAANCRMCLVHGKQNGKDWPKAMPACQTIAADGMEIDTVSTKTQKVQKGVLEFILINHPLDCPVCDKAGECDLQDNYFKYSNQPSRFAEHKEAKQKTYDIGPQIMYDGERCINCTRCIRFMDEIALDSQLAQINRGDRSYIAPAEGKQLDNPYAMNTVDICPVGALLGKDFRFQVRAWFLKPHQSICSGCGRGCNVDVDATEMEQQVHRIRPRENPFVNGPWMCDDGRWTYHRARERRLLRATIREGGKTRQVGLDVALRQAGALLRNFVGTPSFAVAGSAHLTSEDHYVLGRLNAEGLKAGAVAVTGHPPWAGDAFLKLADRNPNRRGALAVHNALGAKTVKDGNDLLKDIEAGRIKALLLVGSELPTTDADRLAAAFSKLEAFVCLSSEDVVTSQLAQVAIPIAWATEVDGLWVNAFGRVQRLNPAVPPPGDAHPAWKMLELLGRQLDVVLRHDSPEAVLADMARQVPLFEGLTYDAVGEHGVARAGETTAPKKMGEGKPPADFPMPTP
ncbi:MAG: 2Fe-2S iron-sulfur cluster-binding protein [Myxococcota bacterium]